MNVLTTLCKGQVVKSQREKSIEDLRVHGFKMFISVARFFVVLLHFLFIFFTLYIYIYIFFLRLSGTPFPDHKNQQGLKASVIVYYVLLHFLFIFFTLCIIYCTVVLFAMYRDVDV